MKKGVFFILLAWNSFAQEQIITVCSSKTGCVFAKVNLNKAQIDNILNKPNFLAKEKKAVILNLVDCVSTIEKNTTSQLLHQKFNGKGKIREIKNFDLKKYFSNKDCGCSNTTKRISFQITSEGSITKGFYFHNLKAAESFMPNESYKEFYKGHELSALTNNSFIRKNQIISYIIDTEGNKRKAVIPHENTYKDITSVAFSDRFKKENKKTGNKKPFLNTKEFQYEYVSKDWDGNNLKLWIVLVPNTCFKKGQEVVSGFHGLGYFVIDGKAYLVSEVSSSYFTVKVTGIQEGSYSFTPVGYK